MSKLETSKSRSLLGFISNEASILRERDPVSSPFLQLAVRGPCPDNCSKSVDPSFFSLFYLKIILKITYFPFLGAFFYFLISLKILKHIFSI